VRPDEEDKPDPQVLGDAYGIVGISITAPADGTKVRLTLRENGFMNTSSWSGKLEKAGTEYYIAPKVNYKFEQLRKAHQQVPLNVTLALEVDGKEAGEQTQTITVRAINDCPFGVAAVEESIEEKEEGEEETEEEEQEEEETPAPEKETGPDDNWLGGIAKNSTEASSESEGKEDGEEEEEADGESDYNDMGWMFAAYVNENSPIVDQILKEAIATRIVKGFGGYQGDADTVLREVLAIWKALQDKGIRYSSITTTAGTSRTVYSQHVRFVDESLANEQANCVDGSVLLASILRKLGLRTFLVTVPGHMYMGVYLTAEGEARAAIETTLIGAVDEVADVKTVKGLESLRSSLDKRVVAGPAWKTFAAAVTVGTSNLQGNLAKIEAADDPDYQVIDIDEARSDGIMPISYEKRD
jgi:hypothetical protein